MRFLYCDIPMHSFSTSQSPFAASVSTITSGNSQPAPAALVPPRGSFFGLQTTVHTLKSTHIPSDYQRHVGLRLLADVSTSQVNPFDALASHRTITFDEEDNTRNNRMILHRYQMNHHSQSKIPRPEQRPPFFPKTRTCH